MRFAFDFYFCFPITSSVRGLLRDVTDPERTLLQLTDDHEILALGTEAG